MRTKYRIKLVVLTSTLLFSLSTLPISFADRNQNYKVSNVANWDALNVRSGAGMEYKVINEIPADSDGISITSNERSIDGTTWVKIKWKSNTGWVNKNFLALTEATAVSSNLNTPQLYSSPTPKVEQQPYFNPYTTTPSSTNVYGAVRPTAMRNAPLARTHRHPANQCTASKTHSHAGVSGHSHHYSCQGRGRSGQRNVVYSQHLKHYHGKSQCVSAISHSHPSGQKIHRHQCVSRHNTYARQAGGQHAHPANSMTRASSHSHPYQDRNHHHQYGR
ncbi:MAG: SH3 domain-containing protein [Cocleimonas sp.]|nr:SH3 domain-containing protein [Cocleimonas sp.]